MVCIRSHVCNKSEGEYIDKHTEKLTVVASSASSGNAKITFTTKSDLWIKSDDDNNPWIQATLPWRSVVYGIKTFGLPLRKSFVTQYMVSYSTDGLFTWKEYKEHGSVKVFKVQNDEREKHYLLHPVLAIHIRIHPIKWINNPYLGVILKGTFYNTSDCMVPIGVADSDEIPDSSFTSPKQYSHQARLNSDLWCPSQVPAGHSLYLSVDFLRPHMITGIATQAGQFGGVTGYSLEFKLESFGWKRYDMNGQLKQFKASGTMEKIFEHLPYAVLASGIKLTVTNSFPVNIYCLAIEVYTTHDGCSSCPEALGISKEDLYPKENGIFRTNTDGNVVITDNMGGFNIWYPNKVDHGIYLRIALKRPSYIVKVSLTNRNINNFVKTYKLAFSNDENQQNAFAIYKEQGVEKIFKAQPYPESLTQVLRKPVIAHYVKVLIQSHQGNRFKMSFEAFTCQVQAKVEDIGMSSGAIRDHQIGASTSKNHQCVPSFARLYGRGAWLPDEFDQAPYLWINFGMAVTIQYIVSAGLNGSCPPSYKLQYQKGINFKYLHALDGSIFVAKGFSSRNITVRKLPHSIQTKSVKFELVDSYENKPLQLELLGKRGNFRDCYDWLKHGMTTSGVYPIETADGRDVMVSCEQEEYGGGWTGISRRIDGSVDFQRDWDTYRSGFGSAHGEHWLGNENIHLLTRKLSDLIIHIKKRNGGIGRTYIYRKFTVGNEKSNYFMTYETYEGPKDEDSFFEHKDNMFSTFDRDNDQNSRLLCAKKFKGGWWHHKCHHAFLNGIYTPGETSERCINWLKWTERLCLAYAVMAVRPHLGPYRKAGISKLPTTNFFSPEGTASKVGLKSESEWWCVRRPTFVKIDLGKSQEISAAIISGARLLQLRFEVGMRAGTIDVSEMVNLADVELPFTYTFQNLIVGRHIVVHNIEVSEKSCLNLEILSPCRGCFIPLGLDMSSFIYDDKTSSPQNPTINASSGWCGVENTYIEIKVPTLSLIGGFIQQGHNDENPRASRVFIKYQTFPSLQFQDYQEDGQRKEFTSQGLNIYNGNITTTHLFKNPFIATRVRIYTLVNNGCMRVDILASHADNALTLGISSPAIIPTSAIIPELLTDSTFADIRFFTNNFWMPPTSDCTYKYGCFVEIVFPVKRSVVLFSIQSNNRRMGNAAVNFSLSGTEQYFKTFGLPICCVDVHQLEYPVVADKLRLHATGANKGVHVEVFYQESGFPASCRDIISRKPGNYIIDPDGLGPVNVYCDQETNGGGWTILQKRNSTSNNFDQSWTPYLDGFGAVETSNFWLGLNTLQRIQSYQTLRFRVELTDYAGLTGFIEYDTVFVDPSALFNFTATKKYRASMYNGVRRMHGMSFSTRGSIHGFDGTSCEAAGGLRGGWWLSSCPEINLNGPINTPDGFRWYSMWTGLQNHTNVSSSIIKVKRKGFFGPEMTGAFSFGFPASDSQSSVSGASLSGHVYGDRVEVSINFWNATCVFAYPIKRGKWSQVSAQVKNRDLFVVVNGKSTDRFNCNPYLKEFPHSPFDAIYAMDYIQSLSEVTISNFRIMTYTYNFRHTLLVEEMYCDFNDRKCPWLYSNSHLPSLNYVNSTDDHFTIPNKTVRGHYIFIDGEDFVNYVTLEIPTTYKCARFWYYLKGALNVYITSIVGNKNTSTKRVWYHRETGSFKAEWKLGQFPIHENRSFQIKFNYTQEIFGEGIGLDDIYISSQTCIYLGSTDIIFNDAVLYYTYNDRQIKDEKGTLYLTRTLNDIFKVKSHTFGGISTLKEVQVTTTSPNSSDFCQEDFTLSFLLRFVRNGMLNSSKDTKLLRSISGLEITWLRELIIVELHCKTNTFSLLVNATRLDFWVHITVRYNAYLRTMIFGLNNEYKDALMESSSSSKHFSLDELKIFHTGEAYVCLDELAIWVEFKTEKFLTDLYRAMQGLGSPGHKARLYLIHYKQYSAARTLKSELLDMKNTLDTIHETFVQDLFVEKQSGNTLRFEIHVTSLAASHWFMLYHLNPFDLEGSLKDELRESLRFRFHVCYRFVAIDLSQWTSWYNTTAERLNVYWKGSDSNTETGPIECRFNEAICRTPDLQSLSYTFYAFVTSFGLEIPTLDTPKIIHMDKGLLKPVENLHVTEISHFMALVKWTPAQPCTSGSYWIDNSVAHDSCTSSSPWGSWSVEAPELRLENLIAGRRYMISLREQVGSTSSEKRYITFSTPPLDPPSIRIAGKTKTTINMQHEFNSTFSLTNIRMVYCQLPCRGKRSHKIFPSIMPFLKLTDLLPDRRYEISLSALTALGYTDQTTITTKTCSSKEDVEPERLTVELVDTDVILVSWEFLRTIDAELLAVYLSYCLQPCRKNVSLEIHPENNSTKLYGIKLGKMYTFSLYGGHVCGNTSAIDTYYKAPTLYSWSQWSSFGPCSVSCGSGSFVRNRICVNRFKNVTVDMSNCTGFNQEFRNCSSSCSIYVWSQWSEPSPCSVSCGTGNMTRTRSCRSELTNNTVENLHCSGLNNVTYECILSPCVDYSWSLWSEWSPCSVSCGSGTSIQRRRCRNMSANTIEEELYCPGLSTKNKTCKFFECPRFVLADINENCDNGCQKQHSFCSPIFLNEFKPSSVFQAANNCTKPTKLSLWSEKHHPALLVKENACVGYINVPKTVHCNIPKWNDNNSRRFCYCINSVDTGFDLWAHWSTCSRPCEHGIATRYRDCLFPGTCSGLGKDSKSCGTQKCKVNGAWGPWQPWTKCSKACEGGTRTRRRFCDSPAPKNGGASCPPAVIYHMENCELHFCPVHGNWGPWSTWKHCDRPCNTGHQRRFRTCDNPSPKSGGRYCKGSESESYHCNQRNCSVVALDMFVTFTNETFYEELNINDSMSFQDLTLKIEFNLRKVFPGTFLKLMVHQFKNGSVATNMTVLISQTRSKELLRLERELYNNHFLASMPVGTFNISTKSVPSLPPGNVRVLGATKTTITVAWDPVPSNSVSGVLDGYMIYWKEASHRAASWTLVTTSDIEEAFTISNLLPYTLYSIHVSAYVTHGNGIPSHELLAITEEGVPLDHPHNVKVQPLDSSRAFVSWGDIPISKHGGFLRGYVIQYLMLISEMSFQGNQIIEVRLGVGDKFIMLSSLQPYTRYSFSIAGFTSKGVGPPYITYFTTLPAVPKKAPSNLNVSVNLHPNQVLVQWRPLERNVWNGIPLGYKLSYRLVGLGATDVSREPKEIQVDEDTASLFIKNLETYSTIEVDIRALNSYGDGPRSKRVIGSTCNCPSSIYALYHIKQPYTNRESWHVTGIFPDLLKNLTIQACGYCLSYGYPQIKFYGTPEGHPSLVASERHLKEQIGKDGTHLGFPIYGRASITRVLGSLVYMSIIQSPGATFLVRNDSSKVKVDVTMALSSGVPIILIGMSLAYICGILIWFAERKENEEEFYGNSYLKGSFHGLWWAFISMTTVGYGDLTPRSILARSLAVAWVVIGVVIIGIFCGAITSALTAIVSDSTIKLYGTEVAALNGSFEARIGILRNAKVNTKREYLSLESVLQALVDKEVDGAIVDTYSAGHLNAFVKGHSLRAAQLLNYETGYGVVLANELTRLETDLRSLIRANVEGINKMVKNRLTTLKVSPLLKDQAIVESILNPTSSVYQMALIILLSIFVALVIAGSIWECWKFRKTKARIASAGRGVLQKTEADNMITATSQLITDLVQSTKTQIDTVEHKHQKQIAERLEITSMAVHAIPESLLEYINDLKVYMCKIRTSKQESTSIRRRKSPSMSSAATLRSENVDRPINNANLSIISLDSQTDYEQN